MSAPVKSSDSQDARAERLAAALRVNLKRRKAQAREQASAKVAIKDTKSEPG